MPLGTHNLMIGLSDNQLEVIMRAAAPLSEENCQEFLERAAGAVSAILQMRGQINDDDIAVAVQLALGALIHNSAAWKIGTGIGPQRARAGRDLTCRPGPRNSENG